MARIVQAALAAIAPFVVIAGTFAVVLAHHLGEPARAAARFEAALAQQGPPPGTAADDDGVTLLRTRCRGACPAYRVNIDGAGRVAFSGQSGVCETRPQSAVIDRAQAQRLILALRDAGFAATPRVVGTPSDGPGTFVELRVGAQAHRVVDHDAPAGDAPLLEAAAAAIDRAAGTGRWLPRARVDGPPWCPLPDGRRGVFANGGMRLVPEEEGAPASSPARP